MPKFISLKQGAKISGYHQDYLSSLIRKGKIKGEKIGRNWCTTEKDLKDYLHRRATEEKAGNNFFKKNARRNLLYFGYAFIVLLVITISFELFTGTLQTVLAKKADLQVDLRQTNSR